MQNTLNKVVHLTSVHPRYDTRIFLKICSSLAGKGYDVSLIVADGKGDEVNNGVKIFDVGASQSGRLSRVTITVNRVFQKAKELDGEIYHLHDPELLPIGLKLKKLGKKVIFDAHEDVPGQILSKPYIHKFLKKFISKLFLIYETFACKKYDHVIAATPHIRDLYIKRNIDSSDINNFPILGELFKENVSDDKQNEVCYIGGITSIRGIREVIAAMQYTKNAKLNLGGVFSETSLMENVKENPGWSEVNYLGFLDRDKVSNVFMKSKAGIVTFLPEPNHIYSQPNKMFEYMSAGLPIIASNFPLWRKIIEGHNCGICVNPSNPKEIASAIDYILTHPNQAEEMGKNARRAIVEKYNWPKEELKLFRIYNEVGRC